MDERQRIMRENMRIIILNIVDSTQWSKKLGGSGKKPVSAKPDTVSLILGFVKSKAADDPDLFHLILQATQEANKSKAYTVAAFFRGRKSSTNEFYRLLEKHLPPFANSETPVNSEQYEAAQAELRLFSMRSNCLHMDVGQAAVGISALPRS